MNANVPSTGKPGSWVVVNRSTGKSVIELFDEKYTNLVDHQCYEVMPVMDYLRKVNADIQAGLSGDAAKGLYNA